MSSGFIITALTAICIDVQCTSCNFGLQVERFTSLPAVETRIANVLYNMSKVLEISPMNIPTKKIRRRDGTLEFMFVGIMSEACLKEAESVTAKMHGAVVEGYNVVRKRDDTR